MSSQLILNQMRNPASWRDQRTKSKHLEIFLTNIKKTVPKANMVVGIGIITFRLHDCRSLKGKRKVVKSIISRMRNRFNASVAEVGSNDIHQRAEIGFTLVGNDRALINSKIDKIFNMVEGLGLAEIIDTEMEIISL